ncbi:hypothetical protein G6F46_013613 [Rhizopus delemar]|nr:hypothetical protein G6F46_013613 [Rhizopus delemar]
MLSLVPVFIVRQLVLLPPPLPAPMPTHTRTPVVASRLSAEVVQFTVMLSVPVVAPGALLLTLPNGSVGSAMAVQTATARAGVAASSPATSSRPSSSILMAPPPGCSAAVPAAAGRRTPPPWAGPAPSAGTGRGWW